MNVEPNFESVLAEAARGQPLSRLVRVPLRLRHGPVTAYHKLRDGTFGFLLESVVGGEQWARYSFLGSRPREAWMLKGSHLSVWSPEQGWRSHEADDPLADLQARLTEARPRPDPRLPRFWGGAVGYFGYDLVRRMERLGPGPPDDQGLPTAMVMFSDVVIAVDNLHGRAKAITTVETGDDTGPRHTREPLPGGRGTPGGGGGKAAVRPRPRPLSLELGHTAADIACDSNFAREDFAPGYGGFRSTSRRATPSRWC